MNGIARTLLIATAEGLHLLAGVSYGAGGLFSALANRLEVWANGTPRGTPAKGKGGA